MRKYLVLVLSISFVLFGSTTFVNTYGNEWNDHANSIIQTSDGGYLFTGCKRDSVDYKYTTFSLSKFNKNGEIDWERAVSGFLSNNEYTCEGYSVIETNDGGYAFSGSLEVFTSLFICTDMFIVKTDHNGNEKWYKFCDLTGQGYRFGFQIIQTSDDGFVIIGESKMFLSDIGDTIILKLDSEGYFDWIKPYAMELYNGRSIVQTKDSGFTFISTFIDEYDNTLQALVKTDSLCNETWRKTYNGLFSYSLGYSLKQTSDGGYIIFGMTDQESYGNLARLIKTDNNGDMLWEKYYGNTDNAEENTVGRSLDLTADGGYILAGYTENRSTGLADAWLIKTDSEGNELWTQTYGGEGDDRIYSVRQTDDGGYILAGYTDSEGAGEKDMWIIKTDENGTEIESPFIPVTTELYQNYPNPFNPVTEIKFTLHEKNDVKLSVFNSKGELVRILLENRLDKGSHTVQFDASELNSGLYFYKLSSNSTTLTRKMLFLK
jgi:hypothetical protein